MCAFGVDKYNFRQLTTLTNNTIFENKKYKLLYFTWIEKLKSQADNCSDSQDCAILRAVLNIKLQNLNQYKMIDVKYLITVLKNETMKNGNNILESLDKKSLSHLIAEPWAIPYLKDFINDINITNDSRLKLLKTQQLTLSDSYPASLIKDQFLKAVQLNKNMIFYNLQFMLPHATEASNIIITPITKPALLLALFALQHKRLKIKQAKALEKVFPGITTETGRTILIDILVPNAKTMLQLNSLYSEFDIINFVAKDGVHLTTPNELPELNL